MTAASKRSIVDIDILLQTKSAFYWVTKKNTTVLVALRRKLLFPEDELLFNKENCANSDLFSKI
jgi:hypothetical protein